MNGGIIRQMSCQDANMFPSTTSALQLYLDQSAAMHSHLCPRQVLGVRAGMYVAQLLGLVLPQRDKRLFAFVETDGCFADGVSVATGCWFGRRTLRLVDYGKVAVTFVDTEGARSLRISPQPTARTQASCYAPDALMPWHAQLEAYKVIPDADLLRVEEVSINLDLSALVSVSGLRVPCDACGEEVMNGREVPAGGRLLCRRCAGDGSYYRTGGG